MSYPFNYRYCLRKMGKRVLAVDFDSQANLTTCFGVDFIPSSIYLSVVDAKLRLEMGAEQMLPGILEPLRGEV